MACGKTCGGLRKKHPGMTLTKVGKHFQLGEMKCGREPAPPAPVLSTKNQRFETASTLAVTIASAGHTHLRQSRHILSGFALLRRPD